MFLVWVVLVDRGMSGVWITLVRASQMLLADLLQRARAMDTTFWVCQLPIARDSARGLTATPAFGADQIMAIPAYCLRLGVALCQVVPLRRLTATGQSGGPQVALGQQGLRLRCSGPVGLCHSHQRRPPRPPTGKTNSSRPLLPRRVGAPWRLDVRKP